MTIPQLNMLSSSALSQNPSLSIRNSSLPLLFGGSSHFSNSVIVTRVSAAPRSYRKFALQCRQSEYYEQKQWSSSQSPSENSSFGASGGGVARGEGTVSSKLYVSHSIYKGKAALTVEPKAPEFTSLDSGATKLSREGFVLLQFAPAAGTRVYDWSRKQVFSLSVTEIGTLIGMSGKDSCEFFHDPFKGKSDEGKVRKVLKVEPLPDGSGHFFNLTVQNKMLNMDESIYIPVTKAEFTVLNSAFSVRTPYLFCKEPKNSLNYRFILPHLLGWSAFANSIKVEDAQRSNNANPRYGGDFEWSRQ